MNVNARGLALLPLFLFVVSTTVVAMMGDDEGRLFGRPSLARSDRRATEVDQARVHIRSILPQILPLLVVEGIRLSDEQRGFLREAHGALQLLLDALSSTEGLAGTTGEIAQTQFAKIFVAFAKCFPDVVQPDVLQPIRATINQIEGTLKVINTHIQSIIAPSDGDSDDGIASASGGVHDMGVGTVGSSGLLASDVGQAAFGVQARANVDDGPASFGRLGANATMTGACIVVFIDGVRHVLMFHPTVSTVAAGVSLLMAVGASYFGRNTSTQARRLIGRFGIMRWFEGRKLESKKKK